MESTRVDRWLWAVRIYKSRSLATDACRGGHVRINGAPAKPASAVRVGDVVRATLGPLERVLEVVEVIDKRVGAPLAASCLVDKSPPPPPRDVVITPFERSPSAGRPTKRDRRAMDRLRRG